MRIVRQISIYTIITLCSVKILNGCEMHSTDMMDLLTHHNTTSSFKLTRSGDDTIVDLRTNLVTQTSSKDNSISVINSLDDLTQFSNIKALTIVLPFDSRTLRLPNINTLKELTVTIVDEPLDLKDKKFTANDLYFFMGLALANNNKKLRLNLSNQQTLKKLTFNQLPSNSKTPRQLSLCQDEQGENTIFEITGNLNQGSKLNKSYLSSFPQLAEFSYKDLECR